jgi:hypothetical protein
MCTDVVPASELSIDVSIEYDMNVVVRFAPLPPLRRQRPRSFRVFLKTEVAHSVARYQREALRMHNLPPAVRKTVSL